MNTSSPFAKAVEEVFRRVSQAVFNGVLPASPVKVYLAGGAAVYLYVAARVSSDVDADFDAKVLLPEVVVEYIDEQGEHKTLQLDQNYRQVLGPMLEDYADRAMPLAMRAPGLRIMILAPVDLAISKLGRFADHDQQDVRSLIEAGLIDPRDFQKLATAALSKYVGNTRTLETSIKLTTAMFGHADSRIGPGGRASPITPAAQSVDLLDALDIRKQPDRLRDCYVLLVAWIALFREPCALRTAELKPDQLRRLGYLISAARLMGHADVHPAWRAIEDEQRPLAKALPPEPLWRCDSEANPFDDLAKRWGFTRGVRSSILIQIIRTGSF